MFFCVCGKLGRGSPPNPCACPRPTAPKSSEVPAPGGQVQGCKRMFSGSARLRRLCGGNRRRFGCRGDEGRRARGAGHFFRPRRIRPGPDSPGPAPQRKHTHTHTHTHTLALLLPVEWRVFCRRYLKLRTLSDSLRPGLQPTHTSLLPLNGRYSDRMLTATETSKS